MGPCPGGTSACPCGALGVAVAERRAAGYQSQRLAKELGPLTDATPVQLEKSDGATVVSKVAREHVGGGTPMEQEPLGGGPKAHFSEGKLRWRRRESNPLFRGETRGLKRTRAPFRRDFSPGCGEGRGIEAT